MRAGLLKLADKLILAALMGAAMAIYLHSHDAWFAQIANIILGALLLAIVPNYRFHAPTERIDALNRALDKNLSRPRRKAQPETDDDI